MTRYLQALSNHKRRYPNARPTTLKDKATQDQTSAALVAFVKRRQRQKRIDTLKRLLHWPKRVWRW